MAMRTEKEGDRSDRPEVSAEFATKHRAAVAWVVYLAKDRLDVGVAAVGLAKTKLFRERVTTNASNVLQDLFMVILTTCHSTKVRKKRTQLLCPQVLIGPRSENHVDRSQEGLCSWGNVAPPRGVGSHHALL